MGFTKKELLKHFKKQKESKASLEKKCWELCREITILRAKGICEYYGCHREGNQVHHIFTKGHSRHLRYDTENLMLLCYTHHKGSNDAAHCDINFKDKILGRYPGYKPIRSVEWFEKLERKAGTPYKLDLGMELIYLTKLKNEPEQTHPTVSD